jgi:hypothetical protein
MDLIGGGLYQMVRFYGTIKWLVFIVRFYDTIEWFVFMVLLLKGSFLWYY